MTSRIKQKTFISFILNFMSIEGGSRIDLGGYFLVCLVLGTQVMGKYQGRQCM